MSPPVDPMSAAGRSDHPSRLHQAWADHGGVTAVFSPKVQDYGRSRPDYPPAVFAHLGQWLAGQPVAPEDRVLADVGAGTGLFTAGLLPLAGRVWAVEPNQAMRAAADAQLGSHPAYRSTPGSAEATGLADASVHLVTAAQTAHWWDRARARVECRRVLAPGGCVALMWNLRLASDPLHQALDQVFARFGGARREAMQEDRIEDLAPAFFPGPCSAHTWPLAHELDEAGLQALAFSRSFMPPRDTAEGRAAEQALSALFASAAESGRLSVRYTTHAWIGHLD